MTPHCPWNKVWASYPSIKIDHTTCNGLSNYLE